MAAILKNLQVRFICIFYIIIIVFLDLKNLVVGTKIMLLSRLEANILSKTECIEYR